MKLFDVIMSALLALVIVAGLVFGSQFLALPAWAQYMIVGTVALVFGSWIVIRHVQGTS